MTTGGPDADPLPIFVSAYAVPVEDDLTDEGAKRDNGNKISGRPQLPSKWSLVPDVETTTDPSQRLRFGAYHVYNGSALAEAGLFYAEDLPQADLDCLKSVAERLHISLLTVSQFREWVFWRKAYRYRANIIGFNLPFDLSRLAEHQDSARGPMMRGGFTFRLSERNWWPNLQIKHLSRRAALKQFAAIGQPDGRSRRKKNLKTPTRRGFLVDLKTTAAALLNELHSLESLCKTLNTRTRKATTEKHGEALTLEYVEYCLTDVQATWECFGALSGVFAEYGLSDTPLSSLYSEASVSKAYLKAMGIRSLLQMQPDIPPTLLGMIMSSYYGGRAEVRRRRIVRQVEYYDFRSMYSTVSVLMNIWTFVTADGIEWEEATDQIRSFLENVTLMSLQDPAIWKTIHALVQLRPDHDLLPVRTEYPGESNTTIGLNGLSCDTPLIFTLADCINSKLQTGKIPEIDRAYVFKPRRPQVDLKPILVAGRKFDPYDNDLLKSLIEERERVRSSTKHLSGDAKAKAERDQQALKVIANTAYGISVQLNVSTSEKKKTVVCYGLEGVPFKVRSRKIETPGPYFHPLLGALITGAARLMLGNAERLIADEGLDWSFCDTDSMAIARPEKMTDAEFRLRTGRIQRWFEGLNPYDFGGSILRLEPHNYGIDESVSAARPLYCFAISAKRYVLFNIDSAGRPVIRKASAHGLGHLIAPYGQDDAPPDIPAPSVPLAEIGVDRWHYDLWYKIAEAALAGHPDRVRLDYHPALAKPAVSQYAVTSPHVLRFFDRYNRNKNYAHQIKAFGFMYSLHAKRSNVSYETWPPKRGRKPKPNEVHPIAPFDRDLDVSILQAFDRETGEPVSVDQLQIYAEALEGYHLRPESKFRNAEAFDIGTTERRHVIATEIIHIGKEADSLDDRTFLEMEDEAKVIYGAAGSGGDKLSVVLIQAVEEFGCKPVADATGISRGHLASIVAGGPLRTRVKHSRILSGIRGLRDNTFGTKRRDRGNS